MDRKVATELVIQSFVKSKLKYQVITLKFWIQSSNIRRISEHFSNLL